MNRLSSERLECRALLAGDILITEFMASNDTSITDADGDSSDWIELFNRGREPVDLRGWALTDDADDLSKWRFPSVTLDPDEFLVVFASDKDRGDVAELHTNFRLSSEGEYLAVVEPDGTISHQYAAASQQTDVSYGVQQRTASIDLVESDSSVRLLAPTSAAEDVPAAEWTVPEFDDQNWTLVEQGLGFDSDGRLNELFSADGNIQSAMLDQTASAYLRSEFQFEEDPASVDELQLSLNYDDGYVAYLNGVEVANSQAPAALRDWTATATAEHGGIVGAFRTSDFSSSEVQDQLSLNGDAEFADERLRLTPSSGEREGSAWLTEALPFGPDYSFNASFALDVHTPGNIDFIEPADGDGVGGHGLTFTLQSGGPFRLGETAGGMGLADSGMTFLAVELDTYEQGAFDPDHSLPTHVGIITSEAGSIARQPIDRFNGGMANQNIRYAWIEYDGSTEMLDVYFASTDDRPDEPVVSANVNVAELFGDAPSLWPGFTAATGANWNAHEILDWQVISTSEELGLLSEEVDLSDHVDKLRSGTNVLAVHGLNRAAADEDFLLRYRLSATLPNVPDLDQPAYFTFPSPGEANSDGSEFPSAEVEFSVTGRNFDVDFTLELSSTIGEGVIRYTTDGQMPSETSRMYSGPIAISDTTRIRARVFEAEKGPGPIRTESFVKLSSSLTNFEGGVFQSNLPVIVLDSFGDGGANSDSRNLHSATAVVIDVGDDGYANLLDEPNFSGPLGMRIRGQSSQGWPKKQYALEFWEDRIDFQGAINAARGPDENVELLDLPADSDWVLNGPYSDKTQLNNYLAFNMYRDVGLQAPRVRLVEVFANFNGGDLNFSSDYRGTYVLMEKIKLDRNRIDRPDAIADPAPGADPKTVGGYVFKKDKDGAGDVNFSTTGHGGPRIPLKFVEPQRPNIAQRNWLTDYVNEFESVLYSNRFDDPETGYAKYIDVGSFIDHWLITELAKEIDGFRLSEYFFLNADGKIEQGPAWDFNLSFSNGNYLDGGQWNRWYFDDIGGSQYHWYPRLFEDTNFVSRLHDRWFELRQNEFAWETLEGKIDVAVEKLTAGSLNYDQPAPNEPSNPISRNFDRWGTIDRYLWPNCFFGQGGSNCRPSPLPSEMSPNGRPNSYDDYIFILKDFVSNRLNWIDEQFGRPPEFSPAGGIVPDGTQVTLDSESPGQIFYTLDGTDPQTGGNGIRYTQPISITENVQIISRSFDAARNEWSSRSAQTYIVNVPPLAVTELHYHPQDSTDAEIAAGFPDSDAFEYFELMNVGAQDFDLQGVRVTDGIQVTLGDETLAAGEIGVVVRNREAFEMRYGQNIRVLGEYGDSTASDGGFRLSNDGERLTLAGALGEPIADFTYNDAWYPLTDGDGFSLVIRDPSGEPASWNAAESWRPSDLLGGSPGSLDQALAPAPGSILINEVLAAGSDGDRIELRNTTSSPIAIGGFYLTDDLDAPQKFRLPADTVLPADGFLVLDDYSVADQGGHILLQAVGQDDTLLGFQAEQRFNAADPDRPEGRYTNSVGDVEFTTLADSTFGRPNSDPAIGSVVITEIMYHASPGETDFVEIYNRSDSTIALASDLWRFSEGIDFAFPVGAALESNRYAVLIEGDDPSSAELEAARFRADHGVPPEVPIYVYNATRDGSLSNGGEDLTIGRLFAADSDNVIPVDQIEYDDEAPWPEGADGEGGSIARLDVHQFGNDPSNWTTGRRGGTPGRDNRFLDVTAPTVPGDLAGRLESSKLIALTWSESVDPESGVDHYRIYRDGQLLGTSAVTRFTDTDVTFSPSGPLRYTVTAVNRDGIESPQTPNPVSFATESRSFQHGQDGYSGALDVEIRSGGDRSPESSLNVDGADGGGETAALLQWRDLSLPAGSLVVGASITLNVFDAGDNYRFYRLRQSWNEDATWNSRGNGNAWQSDGASGPADRGPSVGELVGSPTGSNTTVLDADGVTMVRNWLNNQDDNHGVILANAADATNGVDFDSRESTSANDRPELTILYLPVPEVTPPGDINLDDRVGVADLDILCQGVVHQSTDVGLDLNSDGRVDSKDVNVWLTGAAITNGVPSYSLGDANLDGRFDSGDLVQVFAAGTYEDSVRGNSRWSTGDWNCDGEFNSTDLIGAFQQGGYVQAAHRPSTSMPNDAPRLSPTHVAAALAADRNANWHYHDEPAAETDISDAKLRKTQQYAQRLRAIDTVLLQ